MLGHRGALTVPRAPPRHLVLYCRIATSKQASGLDEAGCRGRCGNVESGVVIFVTQGALKCGRRPIVPYSRLRGLDRSEPFRGQPRCADDSSLREVPGLLTGEIGQWSLLCIADQPGRSAFRRETRKDRAVTFRLNL